jgi:putative transposase
MRRWIREQRAGRRKTAKRGRRRTAASIRRLILKLAQESGWGYTRILGELKKLGIKSVSRNTVKNILKAHGFDPGPQRGVGTWDEFLKLHAATLWQTDFLAKKILTIKGFRDAFVLVFLHVQTRRVFVTPATQHPNGAWMDEQAQAFLQHVEQSGLGADIVMHDRDTKFTASFDKQLERAKLRIGETAFRSPNTLAFAERFIQTLGQECLDYFIPVGERHLNHFVSEMVAHYHNERPHQGLDNDLLAPLAKSRRKRTTRPKAGRDPTILLREVGCKQRLGGLLRHYYRKAG